MEKGARTRPRVRLSPSDERRVWYLMLQIGVPMRCNHRDPARHIRLVQKELSSLNGIVIRGVDLARGNDSIGHYLFRFPRYKRDDSAATRLAEGFLYGMSLVHGPMAEDRHGSLIVRVPDHMLRGAKSLDPAELVELEQSRRSEERCLDFPWSAIGTLSSTTPDRHEAAWRIAAVTFNDEALFDATRFLKRSHDNFFVEPGQICEVASDRDALPRTPSHQTDFEDALQNAFKAIEAVIGDPPRDDRKFFDKIRSIGLDPMEEVGYGAKEAISSVIRKMNEVRDKCSAHGSTRRRAIRPAELLEFQACAGEIALAALEKARGSPLSEWPCGKGRKQVAERESIGGM
jgi:hypothetical protein